MTNAVPAAMPQLSEYLFHDHPIRIIPDPERASFWVVIKDVADLLCYRKASDFARVVPAHHKGAHPVRTLKGGLQLMSCFDEAGLYRAVLRSNKPEAEPFMEWVTAEVLPAIRRTGGYQAMPARDPRTYNEAPGFAVTPNLDDWVPQLIYHRAEAERERLLYDLLRTQRQLLSAQRRLLGYGTRETARLRAAAQGELFGVGGGSC